MDEKPRLVIAILALSLEIKPANRAEKSQENHREIEPSLDGFVNLWIILCLEPDPCLWTFNYVGQ